MGIAAEYMGNTSAVGNTEIGGSDQPDPGKYKTRLCWHFMDKGACIRGDQCNFAHGEDELHVPKTGGGLDAFAPPSPQSCGMEKDSPRAALLTLCGAWGALAIRKPLPRSTMLEYHQLSLNGLPVPPAELQVLRAVSINNNTETPKKQSSRKSTEDSTPSCAGRTSPASQGTKDKKKKKKDSMDSKDSSSKEKNDTEGNGTEKGKRRRRRGR